MAQMKKDGGVYVKMKGKGIAKRIAVTAIAAAAVFGGIQAASITAEAKGTAFINKKTSKVTPAAKPAKRAGSEANVTGQHTCQQSEKAGKVKKTTVAYGLTKNSKKFEAVKAQAKVTKKGKNQYTFTVNNKKLYSYKIAYMTVRFGGKANWTKLVKATGKSGKTVQYRYYLQCSCGKQWGGTNGYEGLMRLHSIHNQEEMAKEDGQAGLTGNGPNKPISIDGLNNVGAHSGYKTWKVKVTRASN